MTHQEYYESACTLFDLMRRYRDCYRDRAKTFAEIHGGPLNIDDWDDDQWTLFELSNDPVTLNRL